MWKPIRSLGQVKKMRKKRVVKSCLFIPFYTNRISRKRKRGNRFQSHTPGAAVIIVFPRIFRLFLLVRFNAVFGSIFVAFVFSLLFPVCEQHRPGLRQRQIYGDELQGYIHIRDSISYIFDMYRYALSNETYNIVNHNLYVMTDEYKLSKYKIKHLVGSKSQY